MHDKIPYILSLAHKNRISETCKGLHTIGLEHFVMYIVFNDGSRFVLSNLFRLLIPYYTEEFYKEDFSFKQEIISNTDYYLCDRTESISANFKSILEDRFSIHRAYYIVRSCAECTFVFGAIKNKKFDDYMGVYKNTIHGFKDFCENFVDQFLDLIKTYNQNYKYSFILNDRRLRKAVITDKYSKGEKLTEREKECLWLASKGKSTKRVAKILNLSPATIETHNKHIREKLNCSTMIEAVVEGIQRGIIGKLNPYVKPGNNIQIDGFKIISNVETAKREISKTNLALLNDI